MSFEAKTMAAFISSRTDYDLASSHVNRNDLSLWCTALFEAVDAYYTHDMSAEHVDLEVLRLSLDRKYKDIPKHAAKMRDMLEEVLSQDGSSINVVSEIIARRRADKGTELADALLGQDDKAIDMYLPEYMELRDANVLGDTSDESFTDVELSDLAERFETHGSWLLAPSELAKRLKGGVRAGHMIIVAARPERGKTLFGINFCAGFLAQGARVLYIGNEDPIPDLVLRLLSNLTARTEDELFADTEGSMDIARANGYDRCTFAGLTPGTLYEVEALIRRYEPDIVIVDQMRNIRANTENNTQRLEVVAQELRNMASRHQCVMLAMTQVGDSGRDMLVLNDGDIDGSNTGIPGACDIIVMIGSNEDFEQRDLRRLTLAKNKRGGNHDNFTVSVDRDLSRVESKAS